MPEDRPCIELVAASAEDTKRYGAALAPWLRPGDTVLLSGGLGSGKTTFAQGLARALGVEGPVTSPSFVLLHTYPTKAGWDLLHADAWRLEQLQEVVDLAIPELVEEGAVALVEWGEKAAPVLPPDCLQVTIDFAGDHGGQVAGEENPLGQASAVGPGPGGSRLLRLRACGPSWQDRLQHLAAALAAPPRP